MTLQQQYDGLMENIHAIYSKEDILNMCALAQIGKHQTMDNVTICQVTNAYGD